MGQITWSVTSVLPIFISHHSSNFLWVIRLTDFVTQLTAVLHAGSLVACHNFLSLRLCFNSRSRPGISFFMSESAKKLINKWFRLAMRNADHKISLLYNKTLIND
jgi:hypothetical protein